MLPEFEQYEELSKDPHILDIIYDVQTPKNTPIPEEQTIWEETKKQSVSEAIDVLIEFLDLPIIIDDFWEDHNKRTKWLLALDDETRNTYQTNVLRANSHYRLNAIEILGFYYTGAEQEFFQDYVDFVLESFPPRDQYELLDFDQKFKTITSMKSILGAFIDYLAIFNPQKPEIPKDESISQLFQCTYT